MMDQHELDMLTRLARSLDNVQTYLAVVDRAEGLRQGNPHPAPSPLSRELSMARAILSTLMAQGTDEGTSTGALLAHIADTDGDPAKVREVMTDRQANELLQDSLVQTGTPTPEARTIADFYVPVQDSTIPPAPGRSARAPMPWYGQVDCDTEDALLARLKEHERTGPITVSDDTRPRWEGREGSAQAQSHAPTPRDLASRLHREDQ